MRILALTRYERLGSSSRVRFYQYLPYIKSHGIEIVNASFFTDKYIHDLYNGRRTSVREILYAYLKRLHLLTGRKSFDLLWVEKEFLPWFPFSIVSILNSARVPYVVDYDDAVFHRYDMHPNPLIRTFLGHKIDQVMRNASMVIAGNDYLAERARKSGALHIEILPSVVDVSKYAVKRPEADQVFKIGWIGSPVTANYLNIVRNAIVKLQQEFAVQLILVGAGNTLPFPEIPTKLLQWSEEIEPTVNQYFDVGIMPLVDGPFERGKCGYKLIQYMAGGIPVVASPVGVNQEIVEININGYLANSTEEWLTALRTLRDDPQKRETMGMAGRQKAERLYNLQVTAPRLIDLLSSVAGQKTNA
ncbi:MAG: glycosyltransferase [Marinirhabdus sp.]|nr:glycosyltransferase [Marinirhabdus sp.]